MLRTRSKRAAKRKTTRAARKGSSSRLKVGDRVRIIDIPSGFKDPTFDLKDAEHREMRTAELFRFCLGREFVIQEFGKYGHADLSVGSSRPQEVWLEHDLDRT